MPDKTDGDLVIRVVAMPADTNMNGDIFGGWVLSQMDLGGGVAARKHAKGKFVTVAINSMQFIKPVEVGDTLCIYAKHLKTGNTSISFHLTTYVTRQGCRPREQVTEADFTYVHIGDDGNPKAIS
jgi:acyl-CoA thioesterase YciA